MTYREILKTMSGLSESQLNQTAIVQVGSQTYRLEGIKKFWDDIVDEDTADVEMYTEDQPTLY